MIFWRQTLVYRDCFVYNKVVWYVRLKESDCSIKEKVKKYAKYIGCDNASLYITRIDAIHTFENA